MLQMPRRSVTRFFIPLIDVLTLLFCIFLMMPAVKRTAEAGKTELEQREKNLKIREEKLRQETGAARRQAVQQALKNLAPRILEIDGTNGKLLYRDPRTPTQPLEIGSEADARELIRATKKAPAARIRSITSSAILSTPTAITRAAAYRRNTCAGSRACRWSSSGRGPR